MIDTFKSKDTGIMQTMVEEALLEIDEDANVSDRELLEMFSVSLAGAPGLYFKVKRDNQGSPVGFLIGRMGTGLFTSDIQANILLAYILPEHRSQDYVLELYTDFEKWAQGKGATKLFFNSVKDNAMINMDVAQAHGIEVKGSILEKNLYK